MNKILNTLKYIFFLITLILTIILSIKWKIYNINILLFYIVILILFIINIRDIKLKINNNHYNILYIIAMGITIFILIRSLYDPNLISNSTYYMEILKNILPSNTLNPSYENISILYFSQNIYYLIIIYISLMIYHKIISNK